jgi:hypothetical protein
MITAYKPYEIDLQPVAQAAVRVGDAVYTLPKPKRHSDILWYMLADLGMEALEEDKVLGYLCSDGRFYTQRLAVLAAALNNQITPEHAHSELVDLW